MSKPILILGATSGIGAAAVGQARGRGHKVRAFARGAAALEPDDLVEPFAGDALAQDDVDAAVKGTRAVIYALGIKERLAMLWENETFFSESTRILLDAIHRLGPKRLVVVTGFGAGRSKDAMSWVERTGHKALLGKPYEDKDRQEALIVESDLDWTIVRPVILTNGSNTAPPRVLRDPSTWRNGLVSRAGVATYLLEAVEDALDVRADVLVAR